MSSNNAIVTGPDDKYGFVRFGSAEQVQRAQKSLKPVQHHRFKSGLHTGQLEYELVNQTKLFVGTNYDAEKQEIDPRQHTKPFIKDATGKPVIPGSTLKGHMRQLFEICTYSCAFMVRGFYRNTGVELRQWPPFQYVNPKRAACQHADHLCPSCRMFGFLKPAFRGRINISDALLQGEPKFVGPNSRLPVLMNPRPKAREGSPRFNDYFAGKQCSGRKVYRARGHARTRDPNAFNPDREGNLAEALNAGHRFRFTVDYRNLESVELAALVTLLDLEPEMFHLLGAAKAHGWGRCTFERVGWREFDMRKRFLEPAGSQTELDGASGEARAHELKTQLETEGAYWHGDGFNALRTLLNPAKLR